MDNEQATKRFHELIWPHRAAVLRAAQILSGSVVEAEDLSQETLLKAFRAIDRFQAGTNAQAWLMTILRNTRIDRLRATGAAARDVSLEDLEWEPGDEVEAELEAHHPQELVERFSDQQVIEALQALPEEIRWTLLLVDVQGREMKEAAEALAVPVGTIKSRLHRGRGMLRGVLFSRDKQSKFK